MSVAKTDDMSSVSSEPRFWFSRKLAAGGSTEPSRSPGSALCARRAFARRDMAYLPLSRGSASLGDLAYCQRGLHFDANALSTNQRNNQSAFKLSRKLTVSLPTVVTKRRAMEVDLQEWLAQ
jgi:hypothetical protein